MTCIAVSIAMIMEPTECCPRPFHALQNILTFIFSLHSDIAISLRHSVVFVPVRNNPLLKCWIAIRFPNFAPEKSSIQDDKRVSSSGITQFLSRRVSHSALIPAIYRMLSSIVGELDVSCGK